MFMKMMQAVLLSSSLHKAASFQSWQDSTRMFFCCCCFLDSLGTRSARECMKVHLVWCNWAVQQHLCEFILNILHPVNHRKSHQFEMDVTRSQVSLWNHSSSIWWSYNSVWNSVTLNVLEWGLFHLYVVVALTWRSSMHWFMEQFPCTQVTVSTGCSAWHWGVWVDFPTGSKIVRRQVVELCVWTV